MQSLSSSTSFLYSSVFVVVRATSRNFWIATEFALIITSSRGNNYITINLKCYDAVMSMEEENEIPDYACSFYVGRVPETIFSTDDSTSLKVIM